ncbi:hypothetical protein BYT27DRAFT_7029613, partial [Phlegmacium glaucopus]
VPGQPRNELINATSWNTINAYPHLFRITTPIHVDHFQSLLSTHPNQPLVESVCRGLRVGFWPWAVTSNSDA